MGSGRDKRKKVKGKKPGAGADKTERKTERNEEKRGRRMERAAQGGEDDIDALLAAFKLKDERHSRVEVQEGCAAPSPRVYASFTPIPSQKENEVILFGGEWYDGDKDKTYVYNDLYVLNVEKQTWKRIISPNGPLPRTSHQAVCTRTALWVWGGEFTSLNQEKFRHYNDMWRLNLADWTWENIPSKGGPSPRSGHRMILHGKRIILVGGFYDSGRETKYYNDVWAFDLEELKWTPLGPKPGHSAPPPRGGHQLALNGDQLFIFGGYYVKKDAPDPDSFMPKRGKKGDEEEEGKGVIHEDVWVLDLKTLAFERVKKQGMAPNPRTAFGLVTHKKRAVLFGGILDQEGKGDRLFSELFNELYQFNLDTRRWYPVALRPPKKSKAEQEAAAAAEQAQEQQAADNGSSDGAAAGGTADQRQQQQQGGELPPGVSPEMHAKLQRMLAEKGGALHAAAARIQANYRGYRVRQAYKTYKLGGEISELLYSPATYGIDFSAKDMIKPRARAAPMMCVLRNTLWMLGGQVEIAHTDIVLDDLWSLDLNKLDGWRCVKENTVGEDAFKDLSSDEWETGSDSE
ncbi:hypothetical protein COHA_001846 [Chlorella ohadii]|uniref:Uncharacterized protein n=1 Tax=Chlorella ohadii TaxID=2649997 RepID=A0AAD5DYI9_9CHLO|nr:hypothetical protein COHA_001846 [Chlorella ohadii]